MSRLRCSVVLIGLGIVGLCLAAESMVLRHLDELKADSIKRREKAVELIVKERKELVNELIRLAKEEVEVVDPNTPLIVYPWHDSKHLAILLLGKLRAVEAVSVLVENIEYRNPRERWVRYGDIAGLYPAVEALSKIGMPAIGPTIEKLAEYHKDGRGRANCWCVITTVLGPKLGKLRLQLAIEEAEDETAKRNLRAAFSYFPRHREEAAEEKTREQKPK